MVLSVCAKCLHGSACGIQLHRGTIRTVTLKLAMLQEDFKITKKIATGGFGTVYRAELDDGKTPGGRPVIIKKVSRTMLVAGFCSFYHGVDFRRRILLNRLRKRLECTT